MDNAQASAPPEPGVAGIPDQPITLSRFEENAAWIVQNTRPPVRVGALVGRLLSLTLPAEIWNPADTIHPFRGALERQLELWNHASNALMARALYQEAKQIQAALYLTLLSLQLKTYQRYLKSMPLCNLGVALVRGGGRIGGGPRWAIRCWLLGVVEEALTNPETAVENINYIYLQKIRADPTLLRQLVGIIETRFLEQATVPLFPESAIELLMRPTLYAPTEGFVKSAETLSKALRESYPLLPDLENPWGTLQGFWDFADWSEGVASGW